MDKNKQHSEPILKTTDELAEEILANPVKKAILELLHEWDGCFFGDIVENIDFPYDEILHNLLELKNMGIIKKSSEPSKFMII